ncbi:MAG: restriction system-associated AAA family ATPase [Microscillaceae bacterium]|jgi:restriction system-associated AAA family ATPase|nr:restriction system-associated AAA family ATPase [Microscillaceae bacterium]
MKLLRLQLFEKYRSLEPFQQRFPKHPLLKDKQEIDPICLVGLNGCGKSNLLELIADIFYTVESSFLENLYSVDGKPYQAYANNKTKKEIFFEIEYEIKLNGIAQEIKISYPNTKARNHEFFIKNKDTNEFELISENQRDYLPLVIAYTSGMNELLSMPFLELQDYYARQVTHQVKKGDRKQEIAEPKLMMMDYETNIFILIANYLLSEQKAKIFDKFKGDIDSLRIQGLSSFRIVVKLDKTRVGKVLLTQELEDYQENLRKCATTYYFDEKEQIWKYDFLINDATKALFKHYFKSSKNLFLALYKLNLLNTLCIEKKYQNDLRKKRKKGQIIKFPTIATLDKIFRVELVELILSKPNVRTEYMQISDGEHQFIHIVGGMIMFDEADTEVLYLFDEPDTHFNPQWRTEFFNQLQKVIEHFNKEIILTTHSPFILGDCRGYNVFVFERKIDESTIQPKSSVSFHRSEYETYGANFLNLLSKFFGFEYNISKKAFNELVEMENMTKEYLEKLKTQINLFGESTEKLLILNHIEELENQN